MMRLPSNYVKTIKSRNKRIRSDNLPPYARTLPLMRGVNFYNEE